MKTYTDAEKATAQLWKTLTLKKIIQSADIAALMIIKAVRSKSNEKLDVAKGLLLKSFTPITNQSRLNRGEKSFQALERATQSSVWSELLSTLTEEEKTSFRYLATTLSKEKWEDNTYVYIFVRKDLEKVQQLVQAAHVTMVLGQDVGIKDHDASRQHFCVLGVGDLAALNDVHDFLVNKKIAHKYFKEPDIGNQMTAIATVPLRKSFTVRKRLFSNYALLEI